MRAAASSAKLISTLPLFGSAEYAEAARRASSSRFWRRRKLPLLDAEAVDAGPDLVAAVHLGVLRRQRVEERAVAAAEVADADGAVGDRGPTSKWRRERNSSGTRTWPSRPTTSRSAESRTPDRSALRRCRRGPDASPVARGRCVILWTTPPRRCGFGTSADRLDDDARLVGRLDRDERGADAQHVRAVADPASVTCWPSRNVPMCESASRTTRSLPAARSSSDGAKAPPPPVRRDIPARPIQSGCSPIVKTVLTDSCAPRRRRESIAAAPARLRCGSTEARRRRRGALDPYGLRSTSLISSGLHRGAPGAPPCCRTATRRIARGDRVRQTDRDHAGDVVRLAAFAQRIRGMRG